VVTTRPTGASRICREGAAAALIRNGLGRIPGIPIATQRLENRVTDPGDNLGPLPHGNMAFTTPRAGTHTVVVRMRPDGTILNRRPQENAQQQQQGTPTAMIPIPRDTIVLGMLDVIFTAS
jgi:hypothetical protein